MARTQDRKAADRLGGGKLEGGDAVSLRGHRGPTLTLIMGRDRQGEEEFE